MCFSYFDRNDEIKISIYTYEDYQRTQLMIAESPAEWRCNEEVD